MHTDELTEVLRKQPFVASLQPWQIDRLVALATQVQFDGDSLIFKEGDHCLQFYVIESGRVALESITPDGIFRVDTLGPGDEMGWSSLLAGTGRHFQARALGAVTAVAFAGEDLLHYCRTDPNLGVNILLRLLEVVSGRLQATRMLMLEQRGLPAADLPGRMAISRPRERALATAERSGVWPY